MLESFVNQRNRLLGSSRFRAFASKLPFFQRVANRSAADLFTLCSGFVQSQALLACIEGGVLHALRTGPKKLPSIAAATALPEPGLAALLHAAVALRLCEALGSERFALGDLGAVLVGNPGLIAMIRHHRALYADLAEPLDLLRDDRPTGQLQQYWAYTDSSAPGALQEKQVGDYTQLMGISQQAVAEQVLAAVRLGNSRHLLDVGGGDGSFAIAAASRWPQLRVTVVDLPAVVQQAQRRVAKAGLDHRIDTVGLDFSSTALPRGHDVVSLVRILHDHNDPVVAKLLQSVAASLPHGGRLLVAEPIAETTRAGRLLEAYFSLYFMAMGQGQLRQLPHLVRLLNDAGFGPVRRLKTAMPLLASVIETRRNDKT